MRFGKFENEVLILFRNPLRTDTEDIFTNDKDILLSFGWKEIVYTSPEEHEGYYPVSLWEETDTQIIQIWTYEPIEDEA